jgi:hypothetical protein
MTERQIEDVTNDQTLRDILRRERTLSVEIVPVLNLSDAARGPVLEPTGQRIGVRQQLGVGVSD